jgi:hypothetical protein
MSDYEIVETMIAYGGAFIRRLGQAWQSADTTNQRRLKDAFPEYWAEYEIIAKLRATR